MTNQEAIRLLDPKSTAEALAEIEYYTGFNGKDAYIKAIEDACIVAIDALKKQIPYETKLEKNSGHYWGRCKCTDKIEYNLDKSKYCGNCGQFLKGRDEE